MTGKTPACHKAFGSRPAENRHDLGVIRERTIADYIIGSRHRNIETRQAIAIDTYPSQTDPKPMHDGPQSRHAPRRITPIEVAKPRCWRHVRPVPAAQPLNAPTLLVNQNQKSAPANRVASRRNQRAKLVIVLKVA